MKGLKCNNGYIIRIGSWNLNQHKLYMDLPTVFLGVALTVFWAADTTLNAVSAATRAKLSAALSKLLVSEG